MVDKRYERNIPAISEEEQEVLATKRVLVVGCGGLGGYVIEYLARLGIGELTVVDGDCFEPNNLNRQLLSSVPLLGHSKTRAAAERLAQINPGVKVKAVGAYFDEDNAVELVQGQDLVIDALDNVASRLLLEDVCASQGLTMVHGAIQGWSMQAAIVRPGSGLLHKIYGTQGGAAGKASLSFTPPFCAAIEVSEAVKLLCGKTSVLEDKVLMVNLIDMDWELFPADSFQDPFSSPK